MRWKTFFSIFTIVLIYTTFPLLISTVGEFLAKVFYGCQERYSNAHTPIGIYLQCPTNNVALAEYWQNTINFNLVAILTVPTGILAIALLIIAQGISVCVKLTSNRLRAFYQSQRTIDKQFDLDWGELAQTQMEEILDFEGL